MAAPADEYVVRDNPDEGRYEILRDGEVVGGIWYRTAPGVIVLVHTEVEPSEEGRGLAAASSAARSTTSARAVSASRRCARSWPPTFAATPSSVRDRESGMTEPSPERERGPRRVYAGDGIEVFWEPKLCIHVRNCVRGLPGVFDPERRPWVEVDAAEADAIAATILTCPTGALHFRRLDGGEQEAAQAETTVEPRPDGPLFVRGRVRIVDDEGRLIREDTRLALCRCGGSANKPFCDGSHRRIGFSTRAQA